MTLNEKEYQALISLLDDDDKEIIQHVENKIISLGNSVAPILKKYIQDGENEILSKKCEILFRKINFSDIQSELNIWFQQKEGNLIHALCLIAKVKHPYLDEKNIAFQIERIVQKIWLKTYQSQTPFEQIQIINYTLFKELEIEVLSTHQTMDEEMYFIHSILESSQGNTIGICLLYMIIAQSLDLPVYMVQLPLNSVLMVTKRWHAQEELEKINVQEDILFYVNPLYFGNTFPKSEIEHYLKKNQINFTEDIFKPINNKMMVKSLIFYIINTLRKKEEHELKDLYINLLNSID